jgi:hypothetical protein
MELQFQYSAVGPDPIPAISLLTDHSDIVGPMAYTFADDMEILKFIAAYYGLAFRGKLPWCFWPTFKRSVGSSRSTSSLYHHWNGAMRKKYGAFIGAGKLGDCIHWLESLIMATNPQAGIGHGMAPPHAGAPLVHHHSQPPV